MGDAKASEKPEKVSEEKAPESEDKAPEIDKLRALAEYVELFFEKVLSILTKPVSHFTALRNSGKPLDVQTWLFAILSITASSYIFQIIAKQRNKTVAFAATYAITLTCWLFYGLFAHLPASFWAEIAQYKNPFLLCCKFFLWLQC